MTTFSESHRRVGEAVERERSGREHPTTKEKNAQRIEITCLEVPGEPDQYKVLVTPKEKRNQPGRTIHEGGDAGYTHTNPFERVFEGEDAEERVLEFIKEIL